MPLISDSIGRVLGGRYRLVSALGTGASAHVFLAEDVSLRRRVAVKVLLPELARDPSFLKRFGAEARSVAALNHPYILQVYDWGEDVDGPYLVLEYLHGGSLRDVLDRGFLLSQAQAAQLGVQAAQGLAYAHARGLVHRDVKPANLLFDEEGRVRVADFGVARALAEAAWTEPAGAMIGTARYASPEQAQGHSVDGRADVYSLALVLYESLTGEVPFVADTTVGTLMARVGAPLPRHPALGTLDDVLARAAAPEVEARLDAAALRRPARGRGRHPPPAGPAPAGPGGDVGMSRAEQALAPDAVQDLTAVVPAPAPAPAPAAAPAPATEAVAATATVAADGRRDAPAGAAQHAGGAAPPSGPAVRQRQRRPWWPWAVGGGGGAGGGRAGGGLRHQACSPRATQCPTWSARPSTPPARPSRPTTSSWWSGHLDRLHHGGATPVARQIPTAGTSLKEGASVTVMPSGGLPTVTVPSLSGMDCARAEQELAAAHLKAKCPAADSPQPDNPSRPGHQLVLRQQAVRHLGPVGLDHHNRHLHGQAAGGRAHSGRGHIVHSGQGHPGHPGPRCHAGPGQLDTVPKGKVIGDHPTGRPQVPVNSTVTVTVSTGPPLVTVPTIQGEPSMATATAALKAAGLIVGRFSGHTDGKVATFTPPAGRRS